MITGGVMRVDGRLLNAMTHDYGGVMRVDGRRLSAMTHDYWWRDVCGRAAAERNDPRLLVA